MAETTDNFGKKWWTSKTLWVNLISLLAVYAQSQTAYVIDADTQMFLLAFVNLFLRKVTKEQIVW